jgi:hypothetical protein
MHFLIQTVKGAVVHDFAFALKQALDFQTWFYGEAQHSVTYSDVPTLSGAIPNGSVIPVGSNEFVFAYMQQHERHAPQNIEPIYIPSALQTEAFLGRSLSRETDIEKALTNSDFPIFVKSATQYKGVTSLLEEQVGLPADEYWLSSSISIQSEWRGFVHHHELLDVRSYAGDFRVMPDFTKMDAMIAAFRNEAPAAYTLDVAVTEAGDTVILEVHPFVSCGLYGFDQGDKLIKMLIDGYRALFAT